MKLKSFLQRLGWGKSIPDGCEPKKEKRSRDRFDIPVHENLQLHILVEESQSSGATLVGLVTNVSPRGCRIVFDNENHIKKVTLNKPFVSSLIIEGFSIPLQAEGVRVIRHKELAVAFKAPYPKELHRLEKFLEPRLLGLSLREINPKFLKKSPEENMKWFQGVNHTEFYSWSDPSTGNVTHQQLFFLGRMVEWKHDESLRTGRILEENEVIDDDRHWPRSDLMNLDKTPDEQSKKMATSLVSSVGVEKDLMNVFLEKLKERQS